MNGFICTKALTLGGVGYEVGQEIPPEAVLPNRVRALKHQGYIAHKVETAAAAAEEPQEEPKAPTPVVIPITKDGKVLELCVAPADIVMAVSAMQHNAEDAAKVVSGIESEEALILIDALDTRKTVKAAILSRVEAMKKPAEEHTDKGQEEQPPEAKAEEEQKTGDA